VFDQFVGYLLDHCEGETIYEESLQRWLAESIEKNKPTESGASE
jgi:regulator of sirC expression with transglutaminase-like and TPR domain